ncbi:MAG: 3-dehydroquinate synthase [Candidatus Sabulitectum sp.]|nr:3-dehydroquinate synthase [Candidatus Sabulitectum sp.]
MKQIEFTFSRPDVSTAVHLVSRITDIDAPSDFLILDSGVKNIYEDSLFSCDNVIELPGGEASKTPDILKRLWLEMGQAKLRRDSRVVVIGGGAVCDAGAFAASTWKRGVSLTLVPTTLLCMVDASLGGKTAVNIAGEKNQAGTVYPASEIIICPEFLQTLPSEEMVNGLAEALKTAVTGDRQIVEYLLQKDYLQAVTACLAVKGRIVAADLEETGERRLLNLGHTIGHCIEAISGFTISHGAAVAMGIPVAAEMGGNDDFAMEFREIARKLGIETVIPSTITYQRILKHLESDKKTTAAGRIWIIPRGWEDCEQVLLDQTAERELLEKAWH